MLATTVEGNSNRNLGPHLGTHLDHLNPSDIFFKSPQHWFKLYFSLFPEFPKSEIHRFLCNRTITSSWHEASLPEFWGTPQLGTQVPELSTSWPQVLAVALSYWQMSPNKEAHEFSRNGARFCLVFFSRTHPPHVSGDFRIWRIVMDFFQVIQIQIRRYSFGV